MDQWEIKMLYDGNCAICCAEVAWLSKWNRRGRLAFEDIAAAPETASSYGVSREDLLAVLHVINRAGTLYTGMDAFRRLYHAVGLGWVRAPTAWPLLRPLFDRLYLWFARNRDALGRPLRRQRCDGDACHVPDRGQHRRPVHLNNSDQTTR